MVKVLALFLCAVTGTQAIWLSMRTISYPSPACLVGRGQSKKEAEAQAKEGINAPLLENRYCNEAYSLQTKPVNGFWNDRGTINLLEKHRHYYCKPELNDGHGSCNAGIGVYM